MPFQYAQTHSPLANTDNRKHKRRVWLVRAHDVQCAPFHAHRALRTMCTSKSV